MQRSDIENPRQIVVFDRRHRRARSMQQAIESVRKNLGRTGHREQLKTMLEPAP